MSTRLDIQTRVQQHFQNPTYFTTSDMNATIQDGLDELTATAGLVYASQVIAFTPLLTYYDMITLLGGNYIGVVAIFNLVINRWIWPSTIRKFDAVRIDWETALGTPYYFSPVNHRYVAFYKKPAATYGNMVVFYLATAPTLVDGTIIPIPEDHLIALNEYCFMDLWEQNQEFTKAQEMLNSYIANAEKLRVLMKNRRLADRMAMLR